MKFDSNVWSELSFRSSIPMKALWEALGGVPSARFVLIAIILVVVIIAILLLVVIIAIILVVVIIAIILQVYIYIYIYILQVT